MALRKLSPSIELNKLMIFEHETQPIENLKAYINHTCAIHRYPEVYVK